MGHLEINVFDGFNPENQRIVSQSIQSMIVNCDEVEKVTKLTKTLKINPEIAFSLGRTDS